eukprot:SAG31_NODE_1369_length_8611_cov_3.505169_7_plen_147_part_00
MVRAPLANAWASAALVVALGAASLRAQVTPPPDSHTSDQAFYCKDVHGHGLALPDDGWGPPPPPPTPLSDRRVLQSAAIALDPYLTAAHVHPKCLSAVDELFQLSNSTQCVPTCQPACQAKISAVSKPTIKEPAELSLCVMPDQTM